MDTARRWQIASLTTAVAGLGAGALLLGRPATAVVPPIEIDTSVAAVPGAAAAEGDDPLFAEIVAPDPVAALEPSAPRVGDDEGDDDAAGTTTSGSEPRPATTSGSEPRPATTSEPTSAEGANAASAGSVDSTDSDDSVE